MKTVGVGRISETYSSVHVGKTYFLGVLLVYSFCMLGCYKHGTSTSTRGFSLVEMSIVVVILGLLVGTIISGKSLMRASELLSITTEYDMYKQAAKGFKDKYQWLPGDMPNATSFWVVAGGTGSD